MEPRGMQTEGRPAHGSRGVLSILADKGLLILTGLVCAGLISGAVWGVNKSDIFGRGNAIVFLLLLLEVIHSRLRIRDLEAQMKQRERKVNAPPDTAASSSSE